MIRISSFDLSLAATGWAAFGPGQLAAGEVTWGTVRPPAMGEYERLNFIRSRVLELSEWAELVVMEGLSYGSNDPSAQERTGLAYLVRMSLFKRKMPFILIAPSTLKKFCTGSGAAKKEMMLREVFRRWNHVCEDNNQSDAVALAYLGMALTNQWDPTLDAQRDVLAVVRKSNPWLQKYVPWEVSA